MFTGIIQTVGTVRRRKAGRLILEPAEPLQDVRLGESISVDGVCLTVDRLKGREVAFQLLPETARVSTLGRLAAGARVNLERSLRAGDRLGGHFLLGHVDGRGRITGRRSRGRALTLEIRVPSPLAWGLVPKGPIAVDGVSLTLGPRMEKGRRVQVHLVSHTLARTVLSRKKKGDAVNLELDLVVKYLRGML